MVTLFPLFSVVCRHAYFTAGVCYPMTIAPSSACTALMRRYRLQFRPTPGGGGGIMYGTDAALLAGFDATAPFDFAMQCNDTALLNYSAYDLALLNSDSNAAFTLSNSIFYCDNLGDASGLLTPAFQSSAVELMPPQFLLSTSAAPAQIALLDALGQTVCYPATAAQLQTKQEQAAVQIVLDGVGEGRYSLNAGGQTLLQFYLSQRPSARQWGALAVYIGGAGQAPYLTQGCPALDANGAPLNPEYQFTMTPRNTYWRYKISSTTLDLSKCSVTGRPTPVSAFGSSPTSSFASSKNADVAAQTVTFTATGPSAGDPYWTFQSDRTLPLSKAPNSWSFTLGPLHTGSSASSAPGSRGGGQIPKIPLPYALGESLVFPDPDPSLQGLGGYSDIYVFL